MANVSFTFGGVELSEQRAEGGPEGIHRACSGFSEERLELGKDLFDGVVVGAVRRQITHLCTSGLDGSNNAGDLVRAQIVHHHNITRLQHGDQYLLYPGAKGIAIDRAIEHARCHQAAGTQGADEGGRMPVAVRRLPETASAFRGASSGRRHVGAGPGLIQKYQMAHVKAALLSGPVTTRLRYVRALLLGGMECLFFRLSPSRARVFHRVVTLT